MQSIFIKIYAGLLLALLLTAALGYSLIQGLNYWRLGQYVEQISQGTFQLISAGLARHDGEKRQSWLAAVNRLTGVDFEIVASNASSAFTVEPHPGSGYVQIQQQLPLSPNLAVSANISGINESLGRITALLILNELGRYKADQRDAALDKIKAQFGYVISKIPRQELDLSQAQLRRLQSGDVFVEFLAQGGNHQLLVYAPYGKSQDVLRLGPVPLFVNYPSSLLLLVSLLSLLLVGIAGYVSVHPLERRLQKLLSSVDDIGRSQNDGVLEVEGSDGLSELTGRINDMSQRIHRLLAAQRELTQAVSHELRTPIARLRFRKELLASAKNDAERELRLQGMEQDIQSLNSLVDEILAYAKLESSQPALSREHLSTEALCQQLSVALEGLVEGITLQFECDVTYIYANAHYIQRLLENLLGNALRYAQSQVVLTFKQDGGQTVICVEDDGPGIAVELQEKVFEPFTRADSSRNRASGGHGLGLAISRQIARWHQGGIEAGDSLLGGANLKVKIPFKSKA